MKQYFIQRGFQKLLDDCDSAEKQSIDLKDGQRCECVNAIVDYGVSVFGLRPETHQYRLLALAAIDLIPALKSKSGSPLVRFLENVGP